MKEGNHRMAAGHQHGTAVGWADAAHRHQDFQEPLGQCPHAQAQRGLGRVWLCPSGRGERPGMGTGRSLYHTHPHRATSDALGSSRVSSVTESGQPWQREPQHCSHAWTGWFSQGWEICWLYGNSGEGALLSQLSPG